MVDRWTICWFICWWSIIRFGLRVLSFTFIGDLSFVSALVGRTEGHNLCATIGKSHSVGSRGHMTITGLIMGEVYSLVVILNSIGKVKWHSRFLVGWGRVGWGMVGWWGIIGWGSIRARSSHDCHG